LTLEDDSRTFHRNVGGPFIPSRNFLSYESGIVSYIAANSQSNFVTCYMRIYHNFSENCFIADPGSSVKILDGRSRRHLKFVGPQYGSCFMSPIWSPKFWSDSSFGKFVHPWAKVLHFVHCVVCGFVRPVNGKAHTHTHTHTSCYYCYRLWSNRRRVPQEKMTDCHPVPMDVHSHSETRINNRICGYMARHNKKW